MIDPELPPLPEGYTARPARMEDADACVALMNLSDLAIVGNARWRLHDVTGLWGTKSFDLSAGTRVVSDQAGELSACGWVIDFAACPVHVRFDSWVRPGDLWQELKRYLLEWGETRARLVIPRCPPDARVTIQTSALDRDEPARELLERHGMTIIRRGCTLGMTFDGAPAEPKWPEGICVRTYRHDEDLAPVWRADQDAFADHWGYVPEQEANALPRWRRMIEHAPDFDPELWFLAMDGPNIAGLCLCEREYGANPAWGFVMTLAVRRDWRRRGLGTALLRHGFVELHRRGKAGVALTADTENLTGAMRLYERVGMRVRETRILYEKELRPGCELARTG
jgi:ribosomal protein S18 acetylase RimI-like enzyme